MRVDPLPVQQAKAYPETAGGVFVSLADFEDVPGGERGAAQVACFAIRPPAAGGGRKFVVNVTRTGVGALEACLPAGAELEFNIPHIHDFTEYKLLSMAVHSRSLRDDLRVTLVTGGATWRSHRTLVRPGWNNVLIDIQRLAEVKGFEITSVRQVRIGFADAAGPVWLNLDDIMLVDNARTIRPTPPGVVLRKSGLDYALTLPGWREPIGLAQCDDGLWRLRGVRADVRLAGPGEGADANGEDLSLMGERRVGAVELLEHNAVRVRLANTWYFPARGGQWASLAVRKIRWEYTFYGDGRWVMHAAVNNAGGREISSVAVRLTTPAAWAGGGVSDRFALRGFSGPVGRWECLVPPRSAAGRATLRSYGAPPGLRRRIAADGAFAPGDAQRDGFDESQGCFYLAAKAGQCRFTVQPPAGGLWDPAFVVAGRWSGPVHVASEGLAIHPVVRRADGSVLFVLPGRVDRPTAVEVTGRQALLDDR